MKMITKHILQVSAIGTQPVAETESANPYWCLSEVNCKLVAGGKWDDHCPYCQSNSGYKKEGL